MTRSRWLIVALITSVTLNLVAAGFLAAAAFRGPPPAPGFDALMRFPAFVRTLSEDRQAELRPVMRQHFRAMRPHVRAMRQAQHRAFASAAADPLDPVEMEQAFAEFREHLNASQVQSHANFLQFVRTLSASERQALIKSLQRPRPPRHHKRPRSD